MGSRFKASVGRTAAALATGAALTVGTAGVASAAPAPAPAPQQQCNPQARWAALADSAPKVSAFLNSHPDVASELAKVKSMPKDQRGKELKAFKQSHQQEFKDFANASAAIRNYHKACHPHVKKAH